MEKLPWTEQIALRLCALVMLVAGGAAGIGAGQLPSNPPKQFGASISPAYEGWFDNPDGTHSFLIGYYSRNTEAGNRHPDRSEQPFRARSRRHGSADALPDPPAVRHVHRHGAEGIPEDPEDHLDADRERRDDDDSVLHAHRLQHHAVQIDRREPESRLQQTSAHAKFEENGPSFIGSRHQPRDRREGDLDAPRPSARRCRSTVWADDDALYSTGGNGPMAGARPAGEPGDLEVPRSRQCDAWPGPHHVRDAQGRQTARAVQRQNDSAGELQRSPATTWCTSPRTTTPATAAADPAAAGRTRSSRLL